MSAEKLQAYFKFDEADLEANRAGKFSEKQKARLAALEAGQRNFNKILGIIMIGLLVFVLLAAPFLRDNHDFLPVGLSFGLICAVIGVIILRTTSNKNRSFRLRKMQGPVKYSRHVPRTGIRRRAFYLLIHIGKSQFAISEDMPNILQESLEYAVYTYGFQGSTHIISAELVSESG